MAPQSLLDRLVTLALIVVPLAFGAYALTLGQDSNWDLRNYHWYNPYAFLGGRLGQDLGAAHIATFYNPLLDLPTFIIGRALPARLTGFLLGTVQGLNFWLLFALARKLIAPLVEGRSVGTERAAAATIALTGLLGGGHLGLIGTTFNDNVISLAVLGAILLIINRADRMFALSRAWPGRNDAVRVVCAGVLLGSAVGLKLPTAPFAVGLCLAFLCAGGAMRRRVALALLFGLGVTAGFAVSGGPWMWVLWRDYANPLFPYFNGVFHSPMGVDASYRDMRFVPRGIGTLLAFPVVFSWTPKTVGEIDFRDFRIVCAYFSLIATAVLALAGRLGGQPRLRSLSAGTRYLIAAAVFSCLPWMVVFGIYRYIVPLEMLAPLIVVVTVAAWPLAGRWRVGLIAAILVLVTVTVHPGDWQHVPWRDGAFVQTAAPPVADPATTLALITGTDPVAWVIPAFPPQIPFIRIYGYLNAPGQSRNGLNDRARARIAAHRGSFFVLFPEKESDNAVTSLAAYGLVPDLRDCRSMTSNLRDDVRWCRVYPDPPRSSTPAF